MHMDVWVKKLQKNHLVLPLMALLTALLLHIILPMQWVENTLFVVAPFVRIMFYVFLYCMVMFGVGYIAVFVFKYASSKNPDVNEQAVTKIQVNGRKLFRQVCINGFGLGLSLRWIFEFLFRR